MKEKELFEIEKFQSRKKKKNENENERKSTCLMEMGVRLLLSLLMIFFFEGELSCIPFVKPPEKKKKSEIKMKKK